MLTYANLARLESAVTIAAARSRPGAVLVLTASRDALGLAERGSKWLRGRIDRLLDAMAERDASEARQALNGADAPILPAEPVSEQTPGAKPLAEPSDAPAPLKRRGRPPKAKTIESAEPRPMAEPAEQLAAEPIAPADIPVPGMADQSPVPETAGQEPDQSDTPPVPPKPRRGRKPKAAPIEAPVSECVTSAPADMPLGETAGHTPVPQTAGVVDTPRKAGRKPKAAKSVKINLSHLRKNNSTLNSRMAGDAESGNDATIQKAKYVARILQKRGLLPDDVSRFSASWDYETQTVTFHDYKTREVVRYQIPAYVMSYNPDKALVSIETDPAPEVSNLSDARRSTPMREFEGEALPIAA